MENRAKYTLYIMKQGFVYIMSNYNRSVLYIGVTNDVEWRVIQHKNGKGSKFTSKYKAFYLLYYERFYSISDAIDREKQLKRWHREWKWNLIKQINPDLVDLSMEWGNNTIDSETIPINQSEQVNTLS